MDRYDHKLLLDIAVMYYLEGKSQSAIAEELFMSVSKVSRALKKAKEKNIVEININYSDETYENLKAEIKKRFQVKTVHITKTLDNELATLKEVSRIASKELSSIVHNDMTIGISWGRHLGMVTKLLPKRHYENISVVEMFGAMSHQTKGYDSKTVGEQICKKLGATLYPLYAPIYVYDSIGHKEVMNSIVVKETLQKINQCDLIITSVGAVGTDNLQVLWSNYLESDMKEEVATHQGVGFVLAHFFNQEGHFIDSKINNSVIGIRTDEIKKQKLFVIASGIKKARAILGALNGNFIDTLIVDEETISKVLKYAKL